jgi:hypothetical protein
MKKFYVKYRVEVNGTMFSETFEATDCDYDSESAAYHFVIRSTGKSTQTVGKVPYSNVVSIKAEPIKLKKAK